MNILLKVAVIGTSNLDKRIQAWSQIKNTDIVGIVPIDKNVDRDLLADQHLQVARIDDLEKQDVDIVDLDVPLEIRAATIRQISKEGIHLICESPLATKVKEVSSIMKECETKNVHLHVGNIRRFSPEYVDAKNQVENGNIGKPGVIRLSSSQAHPGGQNDIFTTLGIPEFDWLTWTFGKVERVMAKQVERIRKNGSPLSYALLLLRLENQAFAHIELSWAQDKRKTSFELTGNLGMLTHNSETSNPVDIQLSGDANKMDGHEGIFNQTALQCQLTSFVFDIAANEKATGTANGTLHAIQIAEAARKSAETGQPVLLTEAD